MSTFYKIGSFSNLAVDLHLQHFFYNALMQENRILRHLKKIARVRVNSTEHTPIKCLSKHDLKLTVL